MSTGTNSADSGKYRFSLKQFWHSFEWPVVLSLGVVALSLGYVGFARYCASSGDLRSPLDLFYLSLQLFILESGAVKGPIPVTLQIARLLAPAVAAYTAVQAFMVIFREQIDMLRVRLLNNHVIICGLGQKGFLIAREFHKHGNRVLIVEQDAANSLIRLCKDLGLQVLIGNATNRDLLQRARVKQARHLIAVTGDEGANAEMAVHARELVKDRKGNPLNCIIHIVEPQLYTLLREQEIATQRIDAFRLDFFNVYEFGAQAWLNQFPIIDPDKKSNDTQVHILLIGLGRMGGSLLSTTARQWSQMDTINKPRLRFSIIDREAERKIKLLTIKYPRMQEVCELIPFQMELNSPEFQNGAFLYDSDGRCSIKSIFVCLHDDSKCLATALNLYQHVRKLKIPIIVRMSNETGLATLLRGENPDDSFHNLHAFGLLDRACKPELILRGSTHEILARAIHRDYVRHERMKGETPATNPSMVSWKELPDNLKESNRQQADHIGVKLKAVNCGIAPLLDWGEALFEFTQDEIELLARMEHDRFVAERMADGWKYGPEPKDIAKKTNPLLVPWEKLSEEDKEKDRNTIRNLPSFLAKTGFKIYRRKEE